MSFREGATTALGIGGECSFVEVDWGSSKGEGEETLPKRSSLLPSTIFCTNLGKTGGLEGEGEGTLHKRSSLRPSAIFCTNSGKIGGSWGGSKVLPISVSRASMWGTGTGSVVLLEVVLEGVISGPPVDWRQGIDFGGIVFKAPTLCLAWPPLLQTLLMFEEPLELELMERVLETMVGTS